MTDVDDDAEPTDRVGAYGVVEGEVRGNDEVLKIRTFSSGTETDARLEHGRGRYAYQVDADAHPGA
jgi:uncharacterized membrane protein YkoI